MPGRKGAMPGREGAMSGRGGAMSVPRYSVSYFVLGADPGGEG